jgi:four helix bundle protein
MTRRERRAVLGRAGGERSFMVRLLRREAKGAAPMNDTNLTPAVSPVLPHHKLHAFNVAKELLVAVLRCSIRDAKLRDEALRSAKSACLNCAEGAGRVTRADKARAFAIARAEAVEAAAAVEIAAMCGDAPAGPAAEVAGGGRMRNGQVAAQEPSSLSNGEILQEP